MPMTFEDVKRGAAELSEEERLQLRAFLLHLQRMDDPGNQAELSRLDRAMDAGDYVTLEDWRELHAKLQAEGR